MLYTTVLRDMKPLYVALLGRRPGMQYHAFVMHLVQHRGIGFLVNRQKGMASEIVTGVRSPDIAHHANGSWKGPEAFLYRRSVGDRKTRSGLIRVMRLLKLTREFLAPEPSLSTVVDWHASLVQKTKAHTLDVKPHVRLKRQISPRPVVPPGTAFVSFERRKVPWGDREVQNGFQMYMSLFNKHITLFRRATPLYEAPTLQQKKAGDRYGRPVVGELIPLIKDGGLKTRVVFSPFTPIQLVAAAFIEPGLIALASEDRSLYHMSQEAGMEEVSRLIRVYGRVSSVDLRSATDNFPLELQLSWMSNYFNKQLVRFMRDVSTGYWRYKESLFSLPVGQPMGLKGSFLLFSLTLSAFIRRTLPSHAYALVGDDMVIGGSEADQDKVVSELEELGVPISHNKSIYKKDIAEFCSRIITRDGPLPIQKGRVSGIKPDIAYDKFGVAAFYHRHFKNDRAYLFLPKPIGVGSMRALGSLPGRETKEVLDLKQEIEAAAETKRIVVGRVRDRELAQEILTNALARSERQREENARKLIAVRTALPSNRSIPSDVKYGEERTEIEAKLVSDAFYEQILVPDSKLEPIEESTFPLLERIWRSINAYALRPVSMFLRGKPPKRGDPVQNRRWKLIRRLKRYFPNNRVKTSMFSIILTAGMMRGGELSSIDLSECDRLVCTLDISGVTVLETKPLPGIPFGCRVTEYGNSGLTLTSCPDVFRMTLDDLEVSCESFTTECHYMW